MSRLKTHDERHQVHNIGWLRAAVLGANDGIISTASLIVGVAASAAGSAAILTAGFAGLVAGAMSMAAGEYVSVSSQADTEYADLTRESRELVEQPESELAELAGVYEGRGVEPKLAREVAKQMMAKDALGIHARDELGITESSAARPIQAALTSAATFAAGAALPLVVAVLSPLNGLSWVVSAASLLFLAFLGAVGSRAGGANMTQGAIRVTFWGAAAMAITALIGWVFGTTVA
jgi:vacuolar iron transporter family protein